MAPFDALSGWGTWPSMVAPLLIGVGFGAALEMSGFGDSRKLAAQFYFKDLTVLKVMFTAIVVAGVLLGLTSALGLLDFERVWVNPTFLLPGLVGGLIMGVGFVIGGFCPGTSVVAASTLKLDGVAFLGGVVLGTFAFTETAGSFAGFMGSTAMGRMTLPALFGVDAGVILVLVTIMALLMFLFGELAEAWFGRRERGAQLRLLPRRPQAWVAAGGRLAVALLTAGLGQPDASDRWEQHAETLTPLLEDRTVYVHPMEVAELTRDTGVYTVVLDVREERDFNLFHLKKSRNISLDELATPEVLQALAGAPGNTVHFMVSNDDARATEAWKIATANGVQNVYIIEGGINRWLTLFPPPPCLGKIRDEGGEEEALDFDFYRAVGDCCNSAYPEVKHRGLPVDCYLASNPDASHVRSAAGHVEAPAPPMEFERKVKLQTKKKASGGCG